MKKYIPLLLLAISIALIFCACGASDSGVSDSEIKRDILSHNKYIEDMGLSVSDMNIVSSEKKDKLDLYIFEVEYTAENSTLVYKGRMTLSYMKTDNGWTLKKWENEEISVGPKGDCDESIPIEYMRAEYARINDKNKTDNAGIDYEFELTSDLTGVSSEEGKSKEHSFTFIVNGRENRICTWKDSWSIDCVFDEEDGWIVEYAARERLSETWDICGTYTLSNDKLDSVLEITSFEIDPSTRTATITYSWQFTSHVDTQSAEKGVTYHSDGPETVVGRLSSDEKYMVLDGNLATVYICGKYSSWDVKGENSDNLGVFLDAYELGDYWMYKK